MRAAMPMLMAALLCGVALAAPAQPRMLRGSTSSAEQEGATPQVSEQGEKVEKPQVTEQGHTAEEVKQVEKPQVSEQAFDEEEVSAQWYPGRYYHPVIHPYHPVGRVVRHPYYHPVIHPYHPVGRVVRRPFRRPYVQAAAEEADESPYDEDMDEQAFDEEEVSAQWYPGRYYHPVIHPYHPVGRVVRHPYYHPVVHPYHPVGRVVRRPYVQAAAEEADESPYDEDVDEQAFDEEEVSAQWYPGRYYHPVIHPYHPVGRVVRHPYYHPVIHPYHPVGRVFRPAWRRR